MIITDKGTGPYVVAGSWHDRIFDFVHTLCKFIGDCYYLSINQFPVGPYGIIMVLLVPNVILVLT